MPEAVWPLLLRLLVSDDLFSLHSARRGASLLPKSHLS
ncbi:unnamed protein product, partial [Protopolystoma xenopodis]